MRVIEPGHVYGMAEVDQPPLRRGEQVIRFVRRRGADGRLLPDDRRRPGLLCQEPLRVLIDRTRYLNDEDPCAEDVEIVHLLRGAFRLFESRSSRLAIAKMPMPEVADACPICHHLLCSHRHPDEIRLGHEVRR